MSNVEELRQGYSDETTAPLTLVTELLQAVWRRRLRVMAMTVAGFVAASGLALLMPNEYQSTAQLMPPDQATISGISTLSLLGGTGTVLPSVAGNLLNARTPGQTVVGILSSRTALDDLVNRFNLRGVYHSKFQVDARKELARHSAIAEDKKTGLLSITVTDTDAGRARDIAKGYVDELNKLLGAVSASSAQKERIFLENRLQYLKNDLDATSRQLSDFSSRNATLDPQAQGQSTLLATQRLLAELATAQTELSGLKVAYSDQDARVRTLEARINEVQSQLRKMNGRGVDTADGTAREGEYIPTLREIPRLGVTYYDLFHRLTMQEAVYEALTRQYELAKVQEAKEVANIKVLDEPEVAERKSAPHRSIIALAGAMLFAVASMAWVIAGKLWDRVDEAHPAKVLGSKILDALIRTLPRTIQRRVGPRRFEAAH